MLDSCTDVYEAARTIILEDTTGDWKKLAKSVGDLTDHMNVTTLCPECSQPVGLALLDIVEMLMIEFSKGKSISQIQQEIRNRREQDVKNKTAVIAVVIFDIFSPLEQKQYLH